MYFFQPPATLFKSLSPFSSLLFLPDYLLHTILRVGQEEPVPHLKIESVFKKRPHDSGKVIFHGVFAERQLGQVTVVKNIFFVPNQLPHFLDVNLFFQLYSQIFYLLQLLEYLISQLPHINSRT